MNHYYLVLYVIINIIIYTTCQDLSCLSPLQKPGKCVRLHDCPELQRVLDEIRANPNRHEFTRYLRSSLCSSHRPFMLCCHKPVIRQPVSVSNFAPNQQQPSRVPSRPFSVPLNNNSLNTNSLLPDIGTCGAISFIQPYIVNGHDATLGRWPWIVQILGRDGIGEWKQFCGGSLISSKYVVTAAHCLDSANPIQAEHVRAGEYNSKTNVDCVTVQGNRWCVPPHQDVEVEDVVPHPRYKIGCRDCNDIALIRLRRDVQFNENVRPICLPLNPSADLGFTDREYSGKLATAAGWGSIDATPGVTTSPDVLQEVHLKIQELSYCRRIKSRYPDKRTVFCAGGEGGRDTCRGDSGGPLVLTMDTQTLYHFLVGITSTGPDRCGKSNSQGIYTNVAAYTQWITANLKP